MQALLWRDYLCPWCYLGRDRTALLESLGVTVDVRSYELHQENPRELEEGKAAGDVAITPLAIPFLAGPAALSTVTVLMARAADDPAKAVLVFLAIALTGAVSYATLRLADPIQRRLGTTGIHVLGRILGLVLAGIAVQFVLDGLAAAGLIPKVAVT